MKRTVVIHAVVALVVISGILAADDRSDEAEVKRSVQQFEEGLNKRDLSKIEPLVAPDMVALENGHRNDGWADFRDNHLVPEMKEPAPPSKTEIMKVRATPQMAWAYTKTEMTLTRKSGEKANVLLWSVYVLEKRGSQWKIVLLDWSIRARPASAS